MLCVTGVYLGDTTNTIFFFNFALECVSSERLLFSLEKIFDNTNQRVRFRDVFPYLGDRQTVKVQ